MVAIEEHLHAVEMAGTVRSADAAARAQRRLGRPSCGGMADVNPQTVDENRGEEQAPQGENDELSGLSGKLRPHQRAEDMSNNGGSPMGHVVLGSGALSLFVRLTMSAERDEGDLFPSIERALRLLRQRKVRGDHSPPSAFRAVESLSPERALAPETAVPLPAEAPEKLAYGASTSDETAVAAGVARMTIDVPTFSSQHPRLALGGDAASSPARASVEAPPLSSSPVPVAGRSSGSDAIFLSAPPTPSSLQYLSAPAAAAPAAAAPRRRRSNDIPGGISHGNYCSEDPFPRGFPLRLVRPKAPQPPRLPAGAEAGGGERERGGEFAWSPPRRRPSPTPGSENDPECGLDAWAVPVGPFSSSSPPLAAATAEGAGRNEAPHGAFARRVRRMHLVSLALQRLQRKEDVKLVMETPLPSSAACGGRGVSTDDSAAVFGDETPPRGKRTPC